MERYSLVRNPEYVLNDTGIPEIILWGRNKDKQLREFRIPFKPRLYVSESSLMMNGVLPEVEVGEKAKDIFGNNVVQLFVKVYRGQTLAEVMKKIRAYYRETYESHVFLTRTFLIDKKIYSDFIYNGSDVVGVNDYNQVAMPRVWILDIEVGNPPFTWPEFTNPIYPIICFSFYDTYENRIHAYVWHNTFQYDVEIKRIVVKVNKPVEKEEWFEIVIHKFSSEPAMLASILQHMKTAGPDMLAGWFSSGYYNKQLHEWVPGFDLPYLINRLNYLRINANRLSPIGVAFVANEKPNFGCPVIRGITLFDLMAAYIEIQKPVHELPSWTLAYVVDYVCGVKATERKPFIGELWQTNPLKALKFNVIDVVNTVLITKYAQILKEFNKRRVLAGVLFDDLFSRHRMNYLILLRERNNKVIPDKIEAPDFDKIKGALVLQPEAGIHTWVVNIDIATAYPEIIVNFNLGPETLNGSQGTKIRIQLYKKNRLFETDVYFKKDEKSLLATILEKWIQKRRETKELLKKARPEEKELYYALDRSFKFLINSQWGVLAEKNYPIYHPYVAGAITAIAREVIQVCMDYARQLDFVSEITYADTDGVYIGLKATDKEDAYNKAKQLEVLLNEKVSQYIKEKYDVKPLKLELSSVYSTIFFRKLSREERAAKKGYAGKVIWDKNEGWCDKVEIKGFEAKKATSSEFVKEAQFRVLDAILNNKPVAEVINIIRDIMYEYKNQPIERIAIPRSIHKGLSMYPKDTAVVRGAKWAEANLGWKVKATKVYYVYVNGVKGYPPTDVISFDDPAILPIKDIQINWNEMYRILQDKLSPYLEALGVRWVSFFPDYKKYKRKIRREKSKAQKSLDVYVNVLEEGAYA